MQVLASTQLETEGRPLQPSLGVLRVPSFAVLSPAPRLSPASCQPESSMPCQVASHLWLCMVWVTLSSGNTALTLSFRPRPCGGYLGLSPGSLASQLFRRLSNHPELRLVPVSLFPCFPGHILTSTVLNCLAGNRHNEGKEWK